jgi:hypothetical protein
MKGTLTILAREFSEIEGSKSTERLRQSYFFLQKSDRISRNWDFNMKTIFLLLGLVASLGGLVCWIIILIDAFKNAVWKGLVGLLCGLYLLYYAITEFEHDKKWMIIGGGFAGSFIGAIFNFMSK